MTKKTPVTFDQFKGVAEALDVSTNDEIALKIMYEYYVAFCNEDQRAIDKANSKGTLYVKAKYRDGFN